MENRLTVQIMGGLGNQMFQYIFGQFLERSLSKKVYYDISFFSKKFEKGVTPRRFELGIFENINIDNIQNFIKKESKLSRYFYACLGRVDNYFEKGHLEVSDIIKLDEKGIQNYVGFWQSHYYCDQLNKSEVKKMFQLKDSCYSEFYFKVKKQITNSESYFLHIRRGDYISNQKASLYHGVCSTQYYIDGIKYIKERNENASFFIFSDDINWCKKEFGDTPFYVDQTQSAIEDFSLMTLCSGGIIANSSFSWWAAYLCKSHKHKVVISPQKWFLSERSVKPKHPSDWIEL